MSASPAPQRPPPFRLIEKLPERVPYLRSVRATQASLGRDVEIRLLPGNSPEHLANLYFQELRDLVRIDHPGFLQVMGDMSLKGRPCYTVPIRDHPTLAELMTDRDFTLEARCEAMRSLASAMAAAHAEGILLGPIPPDRIAWDEDAGVAYYLHHLAVPGDWDTKMLQHTPLAGCPEERDQRDDVFAWGLLAFWMLSRGQHAYGAGPEDLRPLRRIEHQISAGLAMVVEASLAWDPDLRPKAGSELKAVLRMDRTNVACDQAAPPETLDIRKVSSEVLHRVDVLRSSGQIPLRAPRSAPVAGVAGADQALRGDDSLIGGAIDLHQVRVAAKRYGLNPVAAEPVSGGGGYRTIITAVLVLAGVALGASGFFQAPSGAHSPAPVTLSPTPATSRPRTARPGHEDVALQDLLAYQQDILPEDFEVIWTKLQALIVRKKLPRGENDGPRLMRLWMRFRRQPKGACKDLQAWITRLRKKSDGPKTSR